MKLPPGSTNVKKATLTVVTAVLLASLSFTGCGGSGGPTTTQPPIQTTPTPTGDTMDFPPGAYANTAMLANGIFRISWTNTDDTISVGLKAQTTGWIAIALTPSLSKSGADLIIGSVSNGVVNLIDSNNIGYSGSHPQDIFSGGTNDLFGITGSESNRITTIEFKRRLNTGDKNDIALVNGSNRFLFAIGPDDSMATEHGLVGAGEIVITVTHP